MTPQLSDEDDDGLERHAKREGLSKQALAAGAIQKYVAERDFIADVDRALDVLTPRDQHLLDRLGPV